MGLALELQPLSQHPGPCRGAALTIPTLQMQELRLRGGMRWPEGTREAGADASLVGGGPGPRPGLHSGAAWTRKQMALLAWAGQGCAAGRGHTQINRWA